MKKFILTLALLTASLNLSADELSDNLAKCDAGDAKACLKAADFYYAEDKVDPMEFILYKKACELKDGEACFGLAYLYKKNNEPEKAKTYYKKACDSGHDISCDKVK